MHLFFEDEVLLLLAKLEKSSIELKTKFENNDSIEVLRGKFEYLHDIYLEIEKKVPVDVMLESNLKRHMNFLKRYLESGQSNKCESDIMEICSTDIETLRNSYKSNIDSEFIDDELEKRINGLVTSNHLDSAVRVAFLVLTERIREKYELPNSSDGTEMINSVFGNKGVSQMGTSEKEPIRNLLSGLYGFFRNDYMHNLDVKQKSEIATIHMINTMLFLLEDLK